MATCTATADWFSGNNNSYGTGHFYSSSTRHGAEIMATIFNYFISKGLTPRQVCGLMGSITQESHFKLKATNSSSGCKGIFQFAPRYFPEINTITSGFEPSTASVAQSIEQTKKQLDYFWRLKDTHFVGQKWVGSTPGGYWEGKKWRVIFSSEGTGHSLKYLVDAHTWTMERCGWGEANMETRYRAANQLAKIVKTYCGITIPQIEEFTALKGINPDDPSQSKYNPNTGKDMGDDVAFTISGRGSNGSGGIAASVEDICNALINGDGNIRLATGGGSISGQLNINTDDSSNVELDPNGTKPILIGDSWATGFIPHWKGEHTAAGGAWISQDTTIGGKKVLSAVNQIKGQLAKTPNPKFIICYCGRNGGTKSDSTNVKCYEELVKACNGKTIYLIQEQYDCHWSNCSKKDYHSVAVIDSLNRAMISVCNKYENAHFVDLNKAGFHTVNLQTVTEDGKSVRKGTSTLMKCCENYGCGCADKDGTYHLKSYKEMFKTALQVIGQLEYFK